MAVTDYKEIKQCIFSYFGNRISSDIRPGTPKQLCKNTNTPKSIK